MRQKTPALRRGERDFSDTPVRRLLTISVTSKPPLQRFPLPTHNTSLSAKNIGEASHPGPARARSLLRITMSPSTVSFQKSTNNLLLLWAFIYPLDTKLLYISLFSLKTLAQKKSTCVFHCCRRLVFGWRPKALKQLCFNTR